MQPTISDRLTLLYGADVARDILPRLDQMLIQYADAIHASPRRSNLELTERDVMLITYPDQVREAAAPPLETLNEFLGQHVSDVISDVHLLPFYPSSSDDGFSVVEYRAVDSAFGDWKDIARLSKHFDLMFDAVINHVSAESEWFKHFLQDDSEYRDYFISIRDNHDLSQVVRPRALPLVTEFQTASGEKKVWTTFSADQIDLNYHNPDVLLTILDTLLFYVQHGARFIRLDAIAYLWKEIGSPCIHLPQTHAIIQLIRAVLDQVAPWVLLITETNVPHTENISYFGDGADEAQLVYNFALPPLVLDALMRGNATTLSRWARTLELPSNRTTFFNFLASHDGIGVTPVRGILSDAELDELIERVKACGGYVSYKQNADGTTSPYELNINYLDALTDSKNASEPVVTQVSRFIAAQAIMLSLIGVPGIYFHSLFGSRGDRAAADGSRIPRRINRQKSWRTDLERDLADPDSLRAQIFTRLATLVRIRRGQRAFHPHGSQQVIESSARVFALLRSAPDANERILCLHNLANATAAFQIPSHQGKHWLDLLGGKRFDADGGGTSFALQPYQVVWARPI